MRAIVVAVLLAVGACSTADPIVTTEAVTTSTTSTTTVAPAAVPPPRMGHSMVAIGDGELLVFGGRSYQGTAETFLDDTWILDTETLLWRQIDGDGPSSRSQHAMAFDPIRGRVLLFGGYVGSSFTYGDTWLFDVAAERWERVAVDGGPTARAGSVAVFDEEADLYVMFAGAEEPPAAELPLAETWLFDPEANAWEMAESVVVPRLVSEGHPTLFELAMVYDSVARRSVLLVAGESTWLFDAATTEWAEVDVAQTQGLGADYMTAAAYHPGVGTVAYGGAPVERTQGTWVFDVAADAWVSNGGGRGPIANHAMAYDSKSDSVFMFGGAAAVLVLDGVAPVSNELWILGELGWQQVGAP